MGEIYVDDQSVEMDDFTFRGWLANLPAADGNVIAVDTEASGLYVDGKWSSKLADCQPKARVSAVSVAFKRADNGQYITFAVPFDQGRVEGKPGKFNYETGEFDPLDKCEPCPWNFGNESWTTLVRWVVRHRLVFHNAKYDMHIFRAGLRESLWTMCGNCHAGLPMNCVCDQQGIDLEEFFAWDTLLVQGLVEPTESNALDELGKRLFGEGKIDGLTAALKKNGTALTKRYDLLSWVVAGPYAAQDTLLTIKAFYHQQARIDTGVIDSVEVGLIERDFELCKTLYRIENRGVGYDGAQMRIEADKMRTEVDKLKGQLPFQPADITHAKVWFFETLGVIPIKVSDKTGKPSLDVEVVGRLVEQGVKGAAEWQHIQNMESALSKWYQAWPNQIGEDGRLRTNYRQCKMESDRKDARTGGAISGRLSAERVQFQGFPKDYKIPEGIKTPKKMLLAKPGHELWELDGSNMEIRIAAWVTRDPNLVEKCNSGKNIHDENTRAIFGVDEDHGDWNQFRDLSKIGVFSDFYGSGEQTMLSQFEAGLKRSFDIRTVRDFRQRLAEAYPTVKVVSRKAQRKADVTMGGCGYIRLYNGRRRVFGWGERTHKAFNQIMQCNVAEIMKDLMLWIEKTYPGILVNQVHDSVWLEIHSSVAEEVVAAIQAYAVELFERTFAPVKFKVDAKRLV